MELNSNGTVKASSVREVKRIFLKPKESQSITYRLANARRCGVRFGEIVVLDDREFIKVYPWKFHGAGWIEVV